MSYTRGETILKKFQLLPHFVQLCLIIPPITEEVTVPTPNHCHSLNTSRTWTVNHRPSISQHQPQYITDQANGRSLHSNGSVPSRCIFVWCHILRQQNQKWKTKDGLSVSFMEAVWRNILSSSEVRITLIYPSEGFLLAMLWMVKKSKNTQYILWSLSPKWIF